MATAPFVFWYMATHSIKFLEKLVAVFDEVCFYR